MLELTIMPLIGGMIVAVAVSLMLLMNGRVTGISGIFKGLLVVPKGDRSWRMAFFFGLIVGGYLLAQLIPDIFVNESGRSLPTLAMAGLLVGFGTAMANGCTSGHGVCGISRLSVRSLTATIVFIALGVVSVFVFERMLS